MAAQVITSIIATLVIFIIFSIPFFIYRYFWKKGQKFAMQHPLTESELFPHMKEIDVTKEAWTRGNWMISFALSIASGIVVCLVMQCFKEIAGMPRDQRDMTLLFIALAYALGIFIPIYFAIMRRGVAYLLFVLLVGPISTLLSLQSTEWDGIGRTLMVLVLLTSLSCAAALQSSLRSR